ncbi:hypothetical protein P6P90_03700 [Ectobacillus antri]|uniref:DUF3888 domain-containing protein n=1 Tax=Ectobacillus antri TaxID=2486280 RepID=A0ABT6H3C2_9BACI|nr:hypothetical protein [Ectobacillus antri]MDG4655344.1 hypothetical protein [Ectobacillus antri]MDG5753102.1 hypothetical protein [Ectobacillus antri]
MRKILLLFILFIFMFPTVSLGDILGSECPKSENLVRTTDKDKDELVKALNEIIPKVYGASPEYKEWKIEIIEPMPSLTGFEENYYKMAINFCGKEVADHSWFVRLRFPRLLPAQSASLGELYIVKDKNNNWFAWFQYH